MEILLNINENLHPQGQAGGKEGYLKNKTNKKNAEIYEVRWLNVSHHSSRLKRTKPEWAGSEKRKEKKIFLE